MKFTLVGFLKSRESRFECLFWTRKFKWGSIKYENQK
jgi:hypothetical protein